MYISLFLLVSVAFIASVELVKRRAQISSDFTRRVTHIGAAFIAAAAPLFINQQAIIIACLFFAGTLLLARRSDMFSSIHDVKRTTFGDVYLPLGEAISAAIFLPHAVLAFQFGVLVMGISDALAGLVGEKFGRHKVTFFDNTKSLEGATVFFVSTLILALLFVPVFSYQILFIAVILTLVEFLLIYGLDNLVLPIIGSILIQTVL